MPYTKIVQSAWNIYNVDKASHKESFSTPSFFIFYKTVLDITNNWDFILNFLIFFWSLLTTFQGWINHRFSYFDRSIKRKNDKVWDVSAVDAGNLRQIHSEVAVRHEFIEILDVG